MFRRALFWLDLEILVFACAFMISWLATPTFFSSLFWYYLPGLGTELYIGIVEESSFRVMDNFSQGLTFSFAKSFSYTTIILALYISLPILFRFFYLSIGGCLFFSSWYIFLASLGDCSYRDHELLPVSVCLINLLPFFPCLANKVLFNLFFPSVFCFCVFKLGLLEGEENWKGGQQVTV